MTLCPRCGTAFECGIEVAVGDMHCWCMQLPPLPAKVLEQNEADAARDRCFCPDCLRILLAIASQESR